MLKRTISALVLLVVTFPTLIWGGISFFAVITFLLVVASWEYSKMFSPHLGILSRLTLVSGTFFVILARFFYPQFALHALELAVLVALAIHVLDYEQGQDKAPFDFAVSVTGMVYLGWIGAYLIDLRNLPDGNGAWWFMLALPLVWATDTGAYLFGVSLGRHKMAPRLSPKKSWEGYWGGVLSAVAMGFLFSYAYTTWGPLSFEIWKGGLLGLVLGLLTPLGDLGESMFKRSAGVKDSGNIIPGHGGAFDRIDSWLWGGILGYFFITWVIL